MSYYANSEERAGLIAGLRELAEYLDQNPDVPAPCWTDLLVFPPAGSDAEMFTEIDAIASRIGATASGLPAGPTASAKRSPAGSSSARAAAAPATPRTARDEQDDRPHRRRDRHRPALHGARLPQVPRPLALAPPQGVALPQVPEPFRPRPEEVM